MFFCSLVLPGSQKRASSTWRKGGSSPTPRWAWPTSCCRGRAWAGRWSANSWVIGRSSSTGTFWSECFCFFVASGQKEFSPNPSHPEGITQNIHESLCLLVSSAVWLMKWTSKAWSWTRRWGSFRTTSGFRVRPRRWSGSLKPSGELDDNNTQT